MAKAKYSYKGIDGLRKISAKYGINPETLRQRVALRGMTLSNLATHALQLTKRQKKERLTTTHHGSKWVLKLRIY